MQHLKKVFRHRSGFTLNELLCTLILIQFLAFLTLPFLVVRPSTFVYQEMIRLYAALQYTQRKASLEQRASKLIFFVERNSYRSESEYRMHPRVTFGAAAGVCGPPSTPCVPLSRAVTWLEDTVYFTPCENGLSASATAGSVYLTDSAQSCTYAITCDASDGSRFRCYRYTTHWELLPL